MTTVSPMFRDTPLVDADDGASNAALETLKDLLGETLDVLHGALLPVPPGDDGLDEHTRRDLGLS